ncbi:hypothetical protein [Streptomyces sp. H27-H5]|uniref:hypothetical protein n=1 Tax=Streptomyces sp. H27-H5 TaxID=2996460 RepID=UPI00226DD6A3|nr:hypothetical protein [Streptomyces sp. H27-H5]MCY0956040.1 hypothetical protein [Streptomyces sp. H27-H5]
MTLTPRLTGALLLSLLALPAPALAAPAPAPAPGPAVAAGPHRHSAAEISGFLTVFYGKHGPSRYGRDHRVSQVLKDKQRDSPQSDVLLCAQGEPRSIAVGPVTVAASAGVGWATVTTGWDTEHTDTFTAYVRLDSQPIRLDDVICAG